MSQAWVAVPFEVQKPRDGWRLDAYLADRLHRYSRRAVQRLIAAGQVSVAGRSVKAATRLASGQTVIVRYPKHEQPPPAAERLAVLFEDDWLMAVHKPGQMLSHPTDRIVDNAVTTVLRRQRPQLRLHLAHRLDRETSGVLLLAKDAATARLLTDSFTARRPRKTYLAVVAGEVSWRLKRVDQPLERDGGAIKVKQAVGRGLPAVTEFERLARAGSASLLAARPRTGRLHQIRAHLAWLGHPIIGDKLYAGGGECYLKAVRRTLSADDLEALGAARQMLHARELSLPHPVTDEPLTISAPLPPDFKACLARMGLPEPAHA